MGKTPREKCAEKRKIGCCEKCVRFKECFGDGKAPRSWGLSSGIYRIIGHIVGVCAKDAAKPYPTKKSGESEIKFFERVMRWERNRSIAELFFHSRMFTDTGLSADYIVKTMKEAIYGEED